MVIVQIDYFFNGQDKKIAGGGHLFEDDGVTIAEIRDEVEKLACLERLPSLTSGSRKPTTIQVTIPRKPNDTIWIRK